MNTNLEAYDIIELAWAAGLLEGEGSFTKIQNKWNRITCGSVDIDIIVKLKKVFKCGTYTYSHDTCTGKPFYVYRICKHNDATNVMHLILPFMGTRRSAKIMELLNI